MLNLQRGGRPGIRYGNVKVPTNGHPLVRRVFEIINTEGATLLELERRAGIGKNTIAQWRKIGAPTVMNMTAVLAVLGYELRIVRARVDDGDETD